MSATHLEINTVYRATASEVRASVFPSLRLGAFTVAASGVRRGVICDVVMGTTSLNIAPRSRTAPASPTWASYKAPFGRGWRACHSPTTAASSDCAAQYVPATGKNGLPLWNNDHTNFAHVVSVAWDPAGNGKTSAQPFRMSYMQHAFASIDGNQDDNEGLEVTPTCNAMDGAWQVESRPPAPVARRRDRPASLEKLARPKPPEPNPPDEDSHQRVLAISPFFWEPAPSHRPWASVAGATPGRIGGGLLHGLPPYSQDRNFLLLR